MNRKPFILLILYALIVAAAAVATFVAARDMQERTRGVTYGVASQPSFGVNVSLEQYANDLDLSRALVLMRAGGFHFARQHFYWNDIEPRAGEFRWDMWDRIVARAAAQGVELVAVLDTTPAWARSPEEQDLATAPPTHVEDYARLVDAFVRRYGDRVSYLQLWDNPNVHPYWGRRVADPIEYTALLRAGAMAARAANPNVHIISAGLAPNRELIRGHPDYADVLFLRGMYEAGARDYFDILGGKPYGMWTGPEDRRVGIDVFNFSRAILLREEMVAHGDAKKPMWAVEFGWNALPKTWEGKPSPWGSDAEAVQSDRLSRAVERARSEWPWMGALIVQTFQPNAPADDPVWGFALVDDKLQTQPAWGALERAMNAPVPPATFNAAAFYGALVALVLAAAVASWRGAVAAAHISWAEGWKRLAARFAALPPIVQFAALALAVAAFYYSPNVALNFILLALVVLFFSFRLDLGLALAVFAIPFYLLPKNLIGSMQFSLVEVLTLAALAALLLRESATGSLWTVIASVVREAIPNVGLPSQHRRLLHPQRARVRNDNDRTLTSADWAVVFFVLAGLVSVKVAANFGVANREFRVIVLEPALLYALVRAGGFTPRDLARLVDAFILSAVAVSLIGLEQYFFTNYVIIGEGVRRVLAVYGSPNNLALYLERALPVSIALALFAQDRARRVAYAAAALAIALCIYLTWSRGAWLLGLPAGLVVIGLASGRRARLAIAALVVVGAIVLIPFLGTERAQSLFQTGTGTGFFRVSVWQSGVAMIRDHPLLGVGLDNFLYEYPKYMQPEAWREPNLSHPHNIVLDFWVRMGVPGLVALGWLLFEFYRRGIRGIRQGQGDRRVLIVGLLAGLTAGLAHGMIDAAYFYVDLAYVFMLMFAVTVSVSEKETHSLPSAMRSSSRKNPQVSSTESGSWTM